MKDTESKFTEQCMQLGGTDIVVCVRLENESMKIEVKKSDTCVHTVIIDNAEDSLEHAWLIDLFAREDRVGLRDLANDVDEYLLTTNTNQG